MSNKKCPRCGKVYSSSYRVCPYCSRRRSERRTPAESWVDRVVAVLRQHGERIFLVSTAVFLVIAIFGVLLTRCAGQSSEPAEEPGTQDQTPAEPETPPPAEPIAISQTALSLVVGESAALSMSGGDGEGTPVWTSSDSAVAEVSGGTVTAKAAGTATITVSSGLEAVSCTVTVKDKEPDVEVYLNRTDFTLRAKDPPFQMKVKVRETRKEYTGTVVWSSADTSVVTIDEDGWVNRVGKGTTTVTATMGSKVLECIVRVP